MVVVRVGGRQAGAKLWTTSLQIHLEHPISLNPVETCAFVVSQNVQAQEASLREKKIMP